eukprot:Awhi_evm1s7105
MDGLRELIGASNGISINDNMQNYTCVTPDVTVRTLNIPLNEDPAFGLSCCDYKKEYYDSESQQCKGCQPQNSCAESSDMCEGEETTLFTCNKCNDGYAADPIKCTKCIQSQNCIESSVECSLSPGNETYLKCNECAHGLAPDPTTGICDFCLPLSPSCISYDTSCVAGTQQLACTLCIDGRELIEGSCGNY